MKSVLVFVFVVVICEQTHGGLMDNLNFNLASDIGTCAALKGVSPDQLLALSNLQSPTESTTQCFLACVGKKTGLMKMDNSIDRNNAVNTMKPLIDILAVGKNVDSTQVTNSIVNTCAALPVNDNECEAAKSAFNCFAQNARMSGL